MLADSGYLTSPDDDPARFATQLDSANTLVLAFSGLPQTEMKEPLAGLRAAFPHSVLLGCSTSGEVTGSRVQDGGIAVGVARFEHTRLTVAHAGLSDCGSSFAAGARLGSQLRADSLTGVLLLSDGLDINGSQLVEGLVSVLGSEVLITGGLAGDGDRFGTTWVIADDQPRSGVVAAVGLHGDRVVLGYGTRGGWDIFGPQRVITRAEGNVVFEFDGRPALDLYEEYLGDLASGLPGSGLFFPLAIAKHAEDPDVLVRTVLAVHPQDRSLTFAGDVPTGWSAQFMRTNFDRLVEGAANAANQETNHASEVGDCLTLAVSCVGRRLVLKDRIEEELEAVTEALPGHAHLVGFYSYGEIAPVASGRCDLHNQTMTLTTFSER